MKRFFQVSQAAFLGLAPIGVLLAADILGLDYSIVYKEQLYYEIAACSVLGLTLFILMFLNQQKHSTLAVFLLSVSVILQFSLGVMEAVQLLNNE